MKPLLMLLILLTAALAIFVLPGIRSETVQADEPTDPGDLEQARPAFYVRAAMQRSSGVYHDRERVSMTVVSERDAFIYVLYQQVDGEIYQIFPNSIHADNRVAALEEVILGGVDDAFRWSVVPPYGHEKITVIASERRIAEMSRKEQIARQFNPVSDAQFKGIAVDIEELAADSWTCVHVPIETRPAPEAATPSIDVRPSAPKPRRPKPVVPDSDSKRVGLFIGVSDFLFSEEYELAHHGGSACVGSDNDARNICRAMQSRGQLDESKLLIDAQATKKSIKEAVTKWLPNQTRPGDTVFVYFSGFLKRHRDDNGDEIDDGMDDFLCTYDDVDFAVLCQIHRRLVRERPDDEKFPVIRDIFLRIAEGDYGRSAGPESFEPWEHGVSVLEQVAAREDETAGLRIGDMLVRETNISDDEFGQWLQCLEGRKVVVIVETSSSATLADGTKTTDDRTRSLAFLDNERKRLKDIGQRNLAFIASCSDSRSQPLIEDTRTKEVYHPFTKVLQIAIENGESGMLLDDVYVLALKSLMAFAQSHPSAQSQPVFVNDLSEPVYVIP